MREPIGVMGAGWVGLVTAACSPISGIAYEGIGRPSAPVEGRLAPQPVELAGALARSVAAVQVR
jgi:hypothetical protein